MEAADNRSLTALHAQVGTRFRRYQMALPALPESPAHSNQEHAQLLEAIEQRDPARAAALVEQHVKALVQRYREAQSRRNP